MDINFIDSRYGENSKINTGLTKPTEYLETETQYLGTCEKLIQFKNHKSAFYICGRVVLGVLTIGISEYVFSFFLE